MNDASPPLSRFLAPRHWPTWLGLGLLRISVLLPYPALLLLGHGLGLLMYLLLPSRRRIARINLRLCFPEREERAREKLVRATFRSSGMAVFENALSWWGSAARMRRLHQVEGLEHLLAARAAGHGVILLGSHYTTLEISGRFLACHVDGLQPIYKRAHNPLYEAVMVRMRKKLFDDLLESTDMRTIVRNVKSGKTVWYAPDQDFGRERSVFAPFFGVPTATLTTTARLARLTGAPVIPFVSQRLPGLRGYRITLLPPLQGFPSGDDIQDASRTNTLLEQQIRDMPEQYLWIHRRFKTRPGGEQSVYH
ncbi:LpxL/LpxP family Kdo(2)-lipid IV(A) lauroyl/palmitoleoyl acyltransferase [Sulfurivermis fontis]|uniref:LpxL/LpxP family Kdo(2)-lipid IV(A) lauroyl/palmitoleoyl acyltransferase n=1 Tax=Sulfurivermis fontis TaxID=1972068 RepID=UPI000FD93006|nr:LpxL/LpxP family Kdo(2)-lipid IV(A) lauroyl/palmitoleoyl acyltransferase [Sulfurivermis fontis]